MLGLAEAAVGTSTSASTAGPVVSSSDLAKELADIQTQFDAYKLEMGIDSSRLREARRSDFHRVRKHIHSLYYPSHWRLSQIDNACTRSNSEFITSVSKNIANEECSTQQPKCQIWCRVSKAHRRAAVCFERFGATSEWVCESCAEKKIWEVSDNSSFATRDTCLNYPRVSKAVLWKRIGRFLWNGRSYLADLMNNLQRSGENDRRRLEGQLQVLDNQMSVVCWLLVVLMIS